MMDLKLFNIPFVGLNQGNHLFEYEIDNSFFEAFDFDEFHDSLIVVSLDFMKKNTFFELYFRIEGSVHIDCEISLESYDQEIDGKFDLIVKFGSEYHDDVDKILVLPHGETHINVSQYIYELVILSVPSKRVHPKVLDGTMESKALKKLKELEITDKNLTNNKDTDPRWDKLKGLIKETNTHHGTS